MTTTQTFRLPKHFLQDHESRCLLRGEHDVTEGFSPIVHIADLLVKETTKHYFVKLTPTQAQELLSDANYYRDGGGGGMDFAELGGVISSARATYAALIKAGVVAEWE